jgi:hypothetical protein
VPTALWVVVSTLPALIPLCSAGLFDSHDGLFHVYRLAALDRAVRNGVLLPRWFPEFAFGYGHPVLNFYGPVSYYWGLPFTLLGADATLATKLVLATGLVAAALGMYLLARLYLKRGPSLAAAIIYTYLPYHLADLYIRGAVAEFLAFVWFPLVLWAFQRLIENRNPRDLVRPALAALLLVALVTTHSLSALVFAPVLAGYVVLLLWKRHEWRAVGGVILTLALALALSAFYWLPVLAESHYVGLASGVSRGYRNHLLVPGDLVSLDLAYDYSLEPGAPITFPLGWVQAAILGLASIRMASSRRQRRTWLFYLLIALGSAFMLITWSLPVWKALEAGLALLQYPWRFEVLTVLATSILAGALLEGVAAGHRWRGLAAALALVLVTVVWALGSLPVVPAPVDLSVEGMWRTDRALNQIGATWTGEYLPIWVQEQRGAISRSPSEPSQQEPTILASPPGPGQARLTGVGPTRYEMSVDAPQGSRVVLHQFYYPGWQATWQGQTIPAHPEGNLGLTAFDLPPGSGTLSLRLALTPAQWWGTLASLITALALGVAVLVPKRLKLRPSGAAWAAEKEFASLAIAGCALVLALPLLGSLILPNGLVQPIRPVKANLADLAELQGFSFDARAYHPGDRVQVTLYWLALENLHQDYGRSIHLAAADATRQLAQDDDGPEGDFTPTSRWLAGELVPDSHYLTLPADLPAGRYYLSADMFEYTSASNLAVVSSDQPTDGERVVLAEIQVNRP